MRLPDGMIHDAEVFTTNIDPNEPDADGWAE
jgi:hypothetical protein